MSARQFLKYFLFVFVLLAKSSFADAEQVRVTLLHVNDIYQLMAVDKGTRGGLARLATLRDRIRSESPNTLLILGGDTISPSVSSNTFRGAQMIAGWNAVGLDLAVLGNHEFDFGPDVLKTRMDESKFPWVTANVLDMAAGGKLFGTAVPSLVKDFGGVKIGFVGVVTQSTLKSSTPGPNARFLDPRQTVKQEAERLRASGVRYVVAVTHLDMAEDLRLSTDNSVNLILGGHDHDLMQSLDGLVPIFKAGSDTRNVVRIDLTFNSANNDPPAMDWVILPVTNAIAENPAVAGVAAFYEKQVEERYGQTVGTTTVELNARQSAVRSGETNLGNWLADIFRASVKADVALINGGSIRSNAGYGPGTLTRRDLMTILPFDNPIIKLRITGRVLREALEYGLSELHSSRESGRYPQISGMQVKYDVRRPVGQRLIAVEIAGRSLDDAADYTIAVNNYLGRGGDGYAMLKDLPREITAENARTETAEAIEYLSTAGSIAPKVDGRMQRVE